MKLKKIKNGKLFTSKFVGTEPSSYVSRRLRNTGLDILRSHRGGSRIELFENEVLRRMFRPTMEEVIGCWTKLHTEELRKLHPL